MILSLRSFKGDFSHSTALCLPSLPELKRETNDNLCLMVTFKLSFFVNANLSNKKHTTATCEISAVFTKRPLISIDSLDDRLMTKKCL